MCGTFIPPIFQFRCTFWERREKFRIFHRENFVEVLQPLAAQTPINVFFLFWMESGRYFLICLAFRRVVLWWVVSQVCERMWGRMCVCVCVCMVVDWRKQNGRTKKFGVTPRHGKPPHPRCSNSWEKLDVRVCLPWNLLYYFTFISNFGWCE